MESEDVGPASQSANAFRFSLGKDLLGEGATGAAQKLLRRALRVARNNGDDKTADLVQDLLEAK